MHFSLNGGSKSGTGWCLQEYMRGVVQPRLYDFTRTISAKLSCPRSLLIQDSRLGQGLGNPQHLSMASDCRIQRSWRLSSPAVSNDSSCPPRVPLEAACIK